MRISDWSSDVCSSDLAGRVIQLVARGGEGLAEAGRAIVGLEMAGEALDELEEVGLGDLGDLDEGGMTKGVKAEPARAEGELGLALQPRRIDIGEAEAAGNRPFAGRAGMIADVKVGLVEAQWAWKPHVS